MEVIQKIKKLGEIKRIVNESSNFPEMKRKSKVDRYFDNIKWLLKYKKICYPYNKFGLDIKGFRNIDDYMDIATMRKIKLSNNFSNGDSHKNKNLPIKYSLLADNKFIFFSYLNNLMPGITPSIKFVFKGNEVIWPINSGEAALISNLKTLSDGKYICKAVIGLGGNSISLIEKKGDSFVINNGASSLEELIDSCSSENYIIQDYVFQHKDIALLNESTLNTIRIISTRFSPNTNILAAMIRIGVKGQIVDNASRGGTFVGINLETGKLLEYGYYHEAKREVKHPDSGVIYKDYQIPYWKETIELIKTLHPFLYGLTSIGWDIAITEEGPKVIEINWDWGTKGLQIANGGLKKRWEELRHK